MAFQVTPYHQVCVKKMNIYSGEFFLGNAHCLNQNCQDFMVFSVNSVKKQRILHNFANILAKNIGIIVRTPFPPIKGFADMFAQCRGAIYRTQRRGVARQRGNIPLQCNVSLQGAINRRPNNFNSNFTQTTTLKQGESQ
jgi:hypothetical protein